MWVRAQSWDCLITYAVTSSLVTDSGDVTGKSISKSRVSHGIVYWLGPPSSVITNISRSPAFYPLFNPPRTASLQEEKRVRGSQSTSRASSLMPLSGAATTSWHYSRHFLNFWIDISLISEFTFLFSHICDTHAVPIIPLNRLAREVEAVEHIT